MSKEPKSFDEAWAELKEAVWRQLEPIALWEVRQLNRFLAWLNRKFK